MGWKSVVGLGCAAALVSVVWAKLGMQVPANTAKATVGGARPLQASVHRTPAELVVPEQNPVRDHGANRQARFSATGSPYHGHVRAAPVARKVEPNFAQAVRDLRDDDVPSNGHIALFLLSHHLKAAYPSLEPALYSEDAQQRQLAAAALSTGLEQNLPVPPAVWTTLVEALHSDELWGNAACARAHLGNCLEEAFWSLELALYSQDHQQRQYAAELLGQRLGEDWPMPPQLWIVMVEALRNDNISEAFPNAFTSTYRLARYGKPAIPLLRDALRSEDRQQRFLSAAILAWLRDPGSAAQTSGILIERLQSNHSVGDARVACSALWTLGPLALPHLRDQRNRLDAQAHHLVELCIQSIENPAPTAALSLQRVRGVPDRPLATDPFQPDTVGCVRILWLRD